MKARQSLVATQLALGAKPKPGGQLDRRPTVGAAEGGRHLEAVPLGAVPALLEVGLPGESVEAEPGLEEAAHPMVALGQVGHQAMELAKIL